MIFALVSAAWFAASGAAWEPYHRATFQFDKSQVPLVAAGPTSPKGDPRPSTCSWNGVVHPIAAFYPLADPASPPDAPTKPRDRTNPAVNSSARTPQMPRKLSGGRHTACQTKALTDKKQVSPAIGALTVLQIGDSHTSSDYFTGHLRRVLQAQYGRGGVGYMPAGYPDGFRSSFLKITVSPGWKYKSLQSGDANPSEFSFSGYNAIAVHAGEIINITPEDPFEFDSIEIEAMAKPGAGAITVKVNGKVESHRNLQAPVAKPVLIKIAAPTPTATLKEVSVITEGEGTVSLSSISIYNDRNGLTYDSVGYSGATIEILNKLHPALFASVLRRINPSIVVLSFGTNESANKDLDLANYSDHYEQVIRDIEATLPNTVIVIIAPPDFEQISPACSKFKRSHSICSDLPSEERPIEGTPIESMCAWHTPAKLAQVRDIQQNIAERHNLTYWNWDRIMPSKCGAHEWFKATPPLVSGDHVHFTSVGYRRSAEKFILVLKPIIDKLRTQNGAVSHY